MKEYWKAKLIKELLAVEKEERITKLLRWSIFPIEKIN